MDTVAIFADLKNAETLHQKGRERAAARDPKAASESWVQAASILRDAATSITLKLTEMLEFAAAASLHSGQTDKAVELAQEAAGRLRAMYPAGDLLPTPRALGLIRIGQLFCAMQRWDTASALLEASDELLSAVEDIGAARQHAQCLATLATAHHFAGRHTEAIATFERATARARNVAGETNDFADRFAVAELENSFGRTLLTANKPNAAANVLRTAVTNLEALAGPQPSVSLRNLLAATLNRLGHAHAALGERAAAAACLDRSVCLMRVLVEDEGQAGLAEDLRMAIQDQQRLCA